MLTAAIQAEAARAARKGQGNPFEGLNINLKEVCMCWHENLPKSSLGF